MTAAFAPVSLVSRAQQLQNVASKSSATVLHHQDASLVLRAVPSPLLAATEASSSFEPILPDTTTLVGMGLVVALCVVAAIVWNTQVVPVSRTKLAISKSRGDVKEYLEELREDEGERQVEQWLFTDWLDNNNNKSQKAPAVPFLKQAKWNSGDNPVVVTAAIMMVGIVVASVTERVL